VRQHLILVVRPVMKHFRIYISALALTIFAMPVNAGVAPCKVKPLPRATGAPSLPATLHNEYEGFALVNFTVTKSGRVQTPRIVASEWKPIGHSGLVPKGYNEAILTAVAKWKYPLQKVACSTEERVNISHE
jgi:hypothetical protein